MLAGRRRAGGVVSCTVIVKLPVAVLPCASVAEQLTVVVPRAKAYLAERNYQDKLKAALEAHFGTTVTLKVSLGETVGASAAAIEAGERDARRAEAQQAVQSDGFVKDLVNLFDGKVVDSTPRDERK